MTTQVAVIKSNGTWGAEVDLGAAFAGKVNKAVLYDAVKQYLSSQHHGTVKTKDRSEVNRTGKKVYRQKGTGSARHGSKRAPIFVGGGITFGPRPRDYGYQLNKKVRKLALKEAFKAMIQAGNLNLIDKLPFEKINTKEAAAFFKKLEISGALIILNEVNEVVEKSVRNLKNFSVTHSNHLNAYDLLRHPKIVMTQETWNQINERWKE